MGTAIIRAAFEPNFYKRGDYVPGISCDGQNVLAVKRAFQFAKEHALNNGPIVIEMDTYRYHGHSMSDPGLTYRTKVDVAKVKQERQGRHGVMPMGSWIVMKGSHHASQRHVRNAWFDVGSGDQGHRSRCQERDRCHRQRMRSIMPAAQHLPFSHSLSVPRQLHFLRENGSIAISLRTHRRRRYGAPISARSVRSLMIRPTPLEWPTGEPCVACLG